MRSTAVFALGVVALPGAASAATVNVTIPKLNVAEYHKPYVAVWLEPATGGPARTLAVWYDVKKMGGEPGTKWLADLRAWWRKGGRSMAMPANGISGATRAPGTHAIPLPADLKPGQYVLNVEAARLRVGHGQRHLHQFAPARLARGAGSHELGAVTVSAR